MVYSGRTEDTLGHFEHLGLRKPDEMNIPEFLSSDLAPAGQTVIHELEDMGNERAVESSFVNNGNASALKVFVNPTFCQIQLLNRRGWKLVKRNPANLMRLVPAVVSILPMFLLFVLYSLNKSNISPCLDIISMLDKSLPG